MNKVYIRLIKILISVILIFFLISLLDFSKLFDNFKKINLYLLFIPAIIFFLGIWISSIRWGNILSFYNIKLNIGQLSKLYLIGSFYNNFLPSVIGGDGYKYLSLRKRYPQNKKEILASIFLERGIGFISLFLVNFLITFFFIKYILDNSFIIALEIGIILSFILLLIIFIFRKRLMHKIKPKKSKGLIYKIYLFIDTIQEISKNKKTLFYSLLLSLWFIILNSLSLLVLFLSINLHINLLTIIFVVSITSIYSFIPISFNNIGFTETIYIILFSTFNIDTNSTFLALFLGRFISIICSATGGILDSYEKLRSLKLKDI